MEGRHRLSVVLLVLMLTVFSSQFMGYAGMPMHGECRADTGVHEAVESVSSDLLRPGDTIIWETVGEPDNLDPHLNYGGLGDWISVNVYETLYTYPFDSAETDTLMPLLAESLVMSPDGLDYTFVLRQDVRFHDGTPFNASCVKFNIERALKTFDPWSPVWMLAEPILGGAEVEAAVFAEDGGPGSQAHVEAFDAWLSMNAIEVLDTYMVVIHLEHPRPSFIHALSYHVGAMKSPSFQIAHASDPAWASWEEYGVDYGEYINYMYDHTCGTGPYMVSEWVHGDHITLVKNPDYWREPLVLPSSPKAGSISVVEIRTVIDDETRKSNIISDLSDGCFWHPNQADEISPSEIGLSVWSTGLTYSVHSIAFNMRSHYYREDVLTPNPFSIKDFRVACSYAFDYSSFIYDAMYGFAIQAQGPVPTGMYGHDDGLFMYDFDMTSAVNAWNDAVEAGLEDYLAENSYRLELYYSLQDTSYAGDGAHQRRVACETLKAGIDAIVAHESAAPLNHPLTVEVIGLETGYAQYLLNEMLIAFPFAWLVDFPDPESSAWGFGGFLPRYTGYHNPLLVQLIDDARIEMDSEARIQLYSQIQQLMVEDVAYIWTSQPTDFHVERSNVHGYVFNPMRHGNPWPNLFSGGGTYFYYYWKDLSSPSTSVKSSLWWLKEFRNLHQGGDTTYEQSHLERLVDAISASSDFFAKVTSCDEALNILTKYMTKGVKGLAIRELYAVWLNLANGAFYSCTEIDLGGLTSSSTVRDAILECESVLSDEYASIQNMLRVVRIGQEMNAGRYQV